ncbi:MAG: DEAD/DEAH box helicase [Deltaproteobacteria bacterium]|nr:DEAD/DEAH box helicase [Deltaproteobacteria bacterium]
MNDLNLLPALVDAVADMGYTQPTPIQAQAIPIALAGRDLIGCAATGTGKTAAFLLPVLQRLHEGEVGRCRALILSPTRELALQIDEQAQALGYHLGLSAAAVVGGLDMGPQERALRAGAAMVVATPGRLLDHMRFNYVDLGAVEMLILDEADRMLDMGFLPDIQRILAAIPKVRQTLLFSATMSPTIRKLAGEILTDPMTVTVDRPAPATAIVQSVCAVAQERKAALLSTLLRREEMNSVLVFVRRKVDADRLARAVSRGGVAATSIHADRSQEQRLAALDGFRSGEFPVLIATDVAARGLDVSGISHVINFDVPHSSDDYIHRAGRTARAGAAGDVITFVSPDEEERLVEIQRVLGTALPRIAVAGFESGPRLDTPRRGSARPSDAPPPARRSRRRRARPSSAA